MRAHVFQHVAYEGLGEIEPWLTKGRHPFSRTRFFAGDPLPELEGMDWLIIMGGPMNVYEYRAHPWLREEKRFLESALASGKTVLGICLGAQLIADVLGAKVYQNAEKEIGWLPVTWSPPAATFFGGTASPLEVFHWHGDTYDLPAGATWLAESQGCRQQAFSYGASVVGLQFHLEMNAASVAALLAENQGDLTPGRFVQSEAAILKPPTPACGEALRHLLEKLESSRADGR